MRLATKIVTTREGRLVGKQTSCLVRRRTLSRPGRPCPRRLLGIERAKKRTPGKTLDKGSGKTREAAKAWMNPVLVGGLVALILGIIPPFHAAFFSPGGVFTNTNTKAADNLGGLFYALQMFTLGRRSRSRRPRRRLSRPCGFCSCAFISMGVAWSTAGRVWYDSDGLMRFFLILAPSPAAQRCAAGARRRGLGRGLPCRGVPLCATDGVCVWHGDDGRAGMMVVQG
ncbi:hypothetical protein FIBSPDRAFT_850135 [Athelia psychrophila]|uniref:Uncharacterized protein n=1 Tax=Athelia psychrophila TaxID=1759441 RepID=A0A166TJX9_9AGAM|nr:hypothetical protein FIBSPDRAFT_850135 [Fibularhizoctonia sp. CBS 109695]